MMVLLLLYSQSAAMNALPHGRTESQSGIGDNLISDENTAANLAERLASPLAVWCRLPAKKQVEDVMHAVSDGIGSYYLPGRGDGRFPQL